MTLMNYEYYPAISAEQALTYIRDFALAKGWTIDYFAAASAWGATGGSPSYGFVAGNDVWLGISQQAHAYANQYLCYRFRGAGFSNPGAATHAGLELNLPSPGNEAVDYESPTSPMGQNILRTSNTYRYQSVNPQDSSMAVWIFGNDHNIIVFFKMSETICTAIHVGTVELFDLTQAQGNICDYGGVYNWTSYWPWYQGNDNYHQGIGYVRPATNQGSIILYNNTIWINGGATMVLTSSNQDYSIFLSHFALLTRNTFNYNNRVLHKPIVFVRNEDSGDPNYYQKYMPFGTLPYFRAYVNDLQIGEEIKYGTERYLCFPRFYLGGDGGYGYAVRIA